MLDEPSYQIDIAYRGARRPIADRQIRRALSATLAQHGCARACIELALVSDAAIAELNERYLGHPGPTDVLSFPLSEPGRPVLEGQIVLSVQTAARQAERLGHDTGAEVLLYCIHGALHLLGFEDRDDKAVRRMRKAEAEVLEELGMTNPWGGVRRSGTSLRSSRRRHGGSSKSLVSRA